MQRTSPRSSSRELIVAKLEALLDECDLVADPPRRNLRHPRRLFFDKGRKFLQETFQEKVQERIEQTEPTNAEAKQCPDYKKKRAATTKRRKT